MRVSVQIVLTAMLFCNSTLLQGQTPPILGGPPNNPGPVSAVANFPFASWNDPREVSQPLWSQSTIEYNRAALLIRREIVDIAAILVPFHPDYAIWLDGIRDKAQLINDIVLSKDFTASPFLNTDAFRAQMYIVVDGLNHVGDALKKIAATEPGQDPLSSPELVKAFEGKAAEAIQQDLLDLFKIVDADLDAKLKAMKLNIRTLLVKVHTLEHDREVDDFRVRFYWKVARVLAELRGKLPKLWEGYFPGYSSPTNPRRLVAGDYLAQGLAERGQGQPSELQEMKIQPTAENESRIERTLQIVYKDSPRAKLQDGR